ncbi:hypothetical protein [Neobacillus sp.]
MAVVSVKEGYNGYEWFNDGRMAENTKTVSYRLGKDGAMFP